MADVKYIAPDGGWAWVVMFVVGISNITVIPIIQCFGIIWDKEFKEIGISATQTTIILSIYNASGMILGIINGPLIKKYGYRKIAVIGSVIFTIGVISSSFCTTFIHFVITFGIMTSLGWTMGAAAFYLAISTYFDKKRGRAMGWGMTITGLGSIIMPQLVSILLKFYGSKGTMLLLGALSLHAVVGSLLLHPIKWHAVREKPSLEVIEGEGETKDQESKSFLKHSNGNLITDKESNKRVRRSRTTTHTSTEFSDDDISVFELETFFSMHSGSILEIRDPDSSLSNKVLLEGPEKDGELDENGFDNISKSSRNNSQSNKKPETLWKQIFNRIHTLFDLDLLCDPIYVNIMLGVSIAFFAEINFSFLTPFILSEMHLSTHNVAIIMSITASSDLVLRALSPYIGEWLKKSPRTMYLISLFLLIISRTSLIFADGFVSKIFVAISLGISKGIRSVYMSLVIPSHVPLNKLANANSIQLLVNGFIMIVVGPCLGMLRDATGSYVSCIILMNVLTGVTIVMWLTEFMIIYMKNQRCKELMMEIEQKDNKMHNP